MFLEFICICVCDNHGHWSTTFCIIAYYGRNVLIGSVYSAGKPSLLVRDLQVRFLGCPTRNEQKQCMLGYGWKFQPDMAIDMQSVCKPFWNQSSRGHRLKV